MKEIREKLKNLVDNHNLVAIKGGTEIEAMSFEEIYIMREVSKNIVPMTVKIGGPEARNDINYMLSINIDKILAPMIESPYALKNFVETIEDLDKNRKAKLAINLETIFAYSNLHYIFQSPYFWLIEQVTVGRTDLSSSMNKDVDDPEVIKVAKRIVDLARFYGKKTSVGGKVHINNVELIKEKISPDYINTRHMTISCESKNLRKDVQQALLWEKDFYEYLETNFQDRKQFYQKRLSSIEERVLVKDNIKQKIFV